MRLCNDELDVRMICKMNCEGWGGSTHGVLQCTNPVFRPTLKGKKMP